MVVISSARELTRIRPLPLDMNLTGVCVNIGEESLVKRDDVDRVEVVNERVATSCEHAGKVVEVLLIARLDVRATVLLRKIRFNILRERASLFAFPI